MEEKFYLRNRGDGDYFLESRTNNSASVVGSLNPTHFAEHKISLKNCQAIELGYDLDELAKEELLKAEKHHKLLSPITYRDGVIKGFRKALEILGDAKFSERDMRVAYDDGMANIDSVGDYIDRPDEDFNDTIKSLQQTEWLVEIVEEDSKVVESHVWDGSNDGELTWKKQPLFDADGCIILKRK